MSGNQLGEGQCFYKFKAFLNSNWTIKRLTMRNCLGKSSNLKFIAEGLRKNRSLYFLDISHNILEVDDVFTLFEELETNNVMEILKLENCNVSDSYIFKIYDFLMRNCPLRELCLHNNFITDKGAKQILKILMQKHRLISLGLKKNCVNLHTLE